MADYHHGPGTLAHAPTMLSGGQLQDAGVPRGACALPRMAASAWAAARKGCGSGVRACAWECVCQLILQGRPWGCGELADARVRFSRIWVCCGRAVRCVSYVCACVLDVCRV